MAPSTRPVALPVLLALLLLALGAPGAAAQHAYHFSPSGSDTLGDGSVGSPWATLARATALALGPGDSLLFEAGHTFTGTLSLDQHDAGTPERPVVIASYGEGRATIDAGAGAGISIYNAGGIEIRDLIVIGNGVSANHHGGISLYMDLPGEVHLVHVRVDGVDVSGFGRSGLSIGSWAGRSGWQDVRVTRSRFHNNRDGMQTFSQQKGGIRDVYVGFSEFFQNPGTAGFSNPSGSGLVLGGVDGALVERCLAYGNGANNTNSAGPVGIWTYESNAVVIQHNESWGNRTRGGDGGGFDLDGGVTNSVMQYNYSHGNDGAGFGLFQYRGATEFGGNIVRYNISENDGRRNGYGGISVWGASSSDLVRDTHVYHNTVYMSPAERGRPSAVEIKNNNLRGVSFYNNLLITTGGVPLIKSPASTRLRFEGNAYWSSGETFEIVWGGTSLGSLRRWRSDTKQEVLSGADAGMAVDPLVSAPGRGGAVGDPTALGSLKAYRLQPGSPLAAAALDLEGLLGLDSGTSDFFGVALPEGGGRAIGASELAGDGGDGGKATASGPIDEIDVSSRMLIVTGIPFFLSETTVLVDTSGAAYELQNLDVGTHVDVEATAEASGKLVAEAVRVHSAPTTTREPEASPARFALSPAFPNPASSHATIAISLLEDAEVAVTVFDLAGREVDRSASIRIPAGSAYPIHLDVGRFAAGTYLVRTIAVSGTRREVGSTRLTVVR